MTETSSNDQGAETQADDEKAAREAGWTEAENVEGSESTTPDDSDSGDGDSGDGDSGDGDSGDGDSDDRPGTGSDSPTADRVPETGADVDEDELHGDASQLDNDVEKRIDEAGSAKERSQDGGDDGDSSDAADDTDDDDSDDDDSDADGDDNDGDSDDADEPSDEEIEKEREERLDPENRPANAEVDNSARDFDVKSGQFTDHETDDSIGPFNDPTAPDGELEA